VIKRRSFVGALVMLGVAGCGREPYPLAPVSGQVTLDGVPLANVHVNFQPMAAGNANAGPGSHSRTDAEGRYRLQVSVSGNPGAVVGKHQVRISGLGGETSKQSDAGVIGPKDPVPPWYNRDSILTVDVPPEGTDQANFPLTTTKPR
jgi:hypothetical protein